MDPEEFRRRGYELIDFIADYLTRVDRFPVCSPIKPGGVLERLPAHPPEHGVGWDRIINDATADDGPIMAGITHWQHPGFFGFFPANTSYPAILGDLLSSGLGVQGMLWLTSPACTELETRVLDWLAELLGLPDTFKSTATVHGGRGGGGGGGGVIQGTASEATLVALLAARERALAAHPGVGGDRLTLYASTQAHSSVIKAAMIAGMARSSEDRSRVHLVDVDRNGAMRTDELARLIDEDRLAGHVPAFVCATMGTTGTTAVDPIDGIARVLDGYPLAERRGGGTHRPWLHVDAAYAGAALVCPELRWMAKGLEHADSFCFNPHKWLLTTFDCDCFWTRDRESLIRALSVTPEYLRNAASASRSVIDFRDWQVPLGRRFRSLKLWFVLRHYGRSGLQAYIREHVRLAAKLEALVRRDERFALTAPRTTGLLCFALRGSTSTQADDRNRQLLERVNATNRVFLTHTTLPQAMQGPEGGHGAYTLRLAIGAVSTREEHIDAAWGLIREHADAVCSGHDE
jgi:aromatic-L-amino-acid decarboxylase